MPPRFRPLIFRPRIKARCSSGSNATVTTSPRTSAGSSGSTDTPRRRESPTSACMLCSIAARRAAGIVASPTGSEHIAHRGDVAWSPTYLYRPGARTALEGPPRDRPRSLFDFGREALLRNAQPICATTDGGPVWHRPQREPGECLGDSLRRELEGSGCDLQLGTADSEVILHLLARSREPSLEERLIDALSRASRAPSAW